MDELDDTPETTNEEPQSGYLEAEDINAMSEDELERYYDYETREYSKDEAEIKPEDMTPLSEQEINQAISHSRLIDYIEAKREDGDQVKIDEFDVKVRHSKNPTVPYEEDTTSIDGIKLTGKFPVFNSEFDVDLPENLRFASVREQEAYCNAKLREEIMANPDKHQLTEKQVEQIMNGKRPEDFTWHHHQQIGRYGGGHMQLVDKTEHDNNQHAAGFRLYGGEKR